MAVFVVLGACVVLMLGLGWLADRRRRGWDTRRDSRSPGDLYADGKGAHITTTFNQGSGGFSGGPG